MYRKKIWYLIAAALLLAAGCASPDTEVKTSFEEETVSLPEKEYPESVLMSESPISSYNIDDYLFLDDCIYIDTRDPNQFLEEGFIAGFRNLPFYDCLASVKEDSAALFWMHKSSDEEGNPILLGEVGSFDANYIESEEILYALFPKDKNILIISTAGVESTYLMNLLLQYGYDGSRLYNVGCFSNSFGGYEAYRLRSDAKYFIEGTDVYSLSQSYDWGELTPADKE